MKKLLFVVIIFLFTFSLSFTQTQKNSPSQSQKDIYTYRLDDQQKKLDETKAELQKDIKDKIDKVESEAAKKFAENEKALSFQTYIYNYQREQLNSWLSVLGVVLAIFGVFIPVIGLAFGLRVYEDIKKQKEEIEKMKVDAELKLKELYEIVIQGKQQSSELTKLIQNTQNQYLTNEQKTKGINESIKIQKTSNDLIEIKFAKALEFYNKNDFKNALQILENILKYDNTKLTYNRLLDLYLYLGCCFYNISNNEKAIEYYDKIILIDENYGIAYNNKGSALYELKKYNEAIICYNKMIELKPDSELGYFGKATTLGMLDKYREAISYYDEALSLKPNFAEAYHNKGYTLLNLANYSDAILCYNKAIEINPMYESAYLGLVELNIIINDLEKGFKDLNKLNKNILKLKEKDKFSYRFLEIVLSYLNNSYNENTATAFKELKSIFFGDPLKITWSFNAMKKWLTDEHNKKVEQNKKTYILELIRLIEEWRESGKK